MKNNFDKSEVIYIKYISKNFYVNFSFSANR